VWDEPALYPTSGEAFANFTDSASTSRGDPNWCVKTYSATVTTLANGVGLSEFYLSTSDRRFRVSSQNVAQVGTYTVSLVASIDGYPSIQKTIQFQITVLDPCLYTTLIPPSLPNSMTTSVMVQDTNGQPFYETQQVGLFNDSVSLAHSINDNGTEFCSARIYSISFFPITATTALSATELSINAVTGLISVYTARSATIGTHSVTVTVKLSGYFTITSSLPPFTLEILPCIVTAFAMMNLSPTLNKAYKVSDSSLQWNVAGTSITT
jgi:hypothetical protein